MFDATPELILITGPPGAGKSSTAEALAQLYEPSALVIGDDFFSMSRMTSVPETPKTLREVRMYIESAGAVAGLLARGTFTTIYDGTITPNSVNTFAEHAHPVVLRYALLLPPEGVYVQRLTKRTDRSFPDLDVARQTHRQFEAAGRAAPGHVVRSSELAATVARQIFERIAADGMRLKVR